MKQKINDMPRPDLSTVPHFFHKYILQTEEDDALQAIQTNGEKAVRFLQEIDEDKWAYRYAEGKWSIKEMVQHLIDAERIFVYRALCIARGEQTSLPGFDENRYAAHSKADNRRKHELTAEFETLRQSTSQLFASFDDEQLKATGIANNASVSVNGLGFIIPGHVQHHLNILEERYLSQ